MLDVGDGGGHGADDDRVGRSSRCRQQGESGEAAERLEPARGDVLMRHRVAQGVRQQPETERAPP